MKFLSSFTGLLLAFLLFTGCAQRAYHQHDDSFDLTSVSTYAWADADDDKIAVVEELSIIIFGTAGGAGGGSASDESFADNSR